MAPKMFFTFGEIERDWQRMFSTALHAAEESKKCGARSSLEELVSLDLITKLDPGHDSLEYFGLIDRIKAEFARRRQAEKAKSTMEHEPEEQLSFALEHRYEHVHDEAHLGVLTRLKFFDESTTDSAARDIWYEVEKSMRRVEKAREPGGVEELRRESKERRDRQMDDIERARYEGFCLRSGIDPELGQCTDEREVREVLKARASK